MDKLWESGEMSNEKLQKCSQNICARFINKLTMQRNIVLDTNCLLQIIARKKQELFLMGRILEW